MLLQITNRRDWSMVHNKRTSRLLCWKCQYDKLGIIIIYRLTNIR